jgi:hypothetical protein
MVKGSFNVFPSGSGWSLLLGKPLLKQFKVVHNYDDDTLMISKDSVWTTLVNKLGRAPKFTEGSAHPPKEDTEFPSVIQCLWLN